MRRSTIIYLLLFVIVLGAAYYFNSHKNATDIGTPTETTTPVEYLFTAADGLPTRIQIEAKTGEVVEVERNADNAWVLIKPEEVAADQGTVEAAATQVSTMRILDHLPNMAPDAVGLDNPEYTLTIQFTSGVERKSEIGVSTPTQSGYYVRGNDGEIVIVSSDSVDSLLKLLTNPPYVPTETPAPEATP